MNEFEGYLSRHEKQWEADNAALERGEEGMIVKGKIENSPNTYLGYTKKGFDRMIKALGWIIVTKNGIEYLVLSKHLRDKILKGD